MREITAGAQHKIHDLAQQIKAEGDCSYFDQQFAAAYSDITGCLERDAVAMVRSLASRSLAQGDYKNRRNQYGLAIQRACDWLLTWYAAGHEHTIHSCASFVAERDPAFCWAVFLRHEK